ncbi:DUF59 domain-containing protein [Phaeobacter inhibens]|uniref:metal-sulfur cluster assembly factor n=1 Tax=Phaeobacter inhibens TaxID=221822 RepID=UPI0001632FC2|nr:iron-sulfur cluster assembly protein [Phaeobacter inhibens]AFO91908.1 hypothetical protein PGA1_c22220 [Phaeobacter inhibens DSM 17395]AUQ46575.1 FeS assembly SUF system protein [Phaeobacter inhibens]AXT23268.1 DUF59 domain-containing protein [Phaeobacter inhibens]
MIFALIDLIVILLGALLLYEFKARIGQICNFLITKALKRMRIDQKHALESEWNAVLCEQPTELSKFLTSVGFLVTSVKIGRRVWDLEDIAGSLTHDQIIDALRRIYDPEIPINIFDLGYVTEFKFYGGIAKVRYTTADSHKTCVFNSSPCAQAIKFKEDLALRIHDSLQKLSDIESIEVRHDDEIKWEIEHMSDEAREELGFM